MIQQEILKIGDIRTDRRTTRMKIVITTVHDCSSAKWINIQYVAVYNMIQEFNVHFVDVPMNLRPEFADQDCHMLK